MKDRSKEILAMRPKLDLTKDLTEGNDLNLFQTEVLRPILKLQNDILTSYFKSRIHLGSESIDKIHIEKLISSSLSKEQSMKGFLLGMVVGLFTEVEMKFYAEHQKEINKRIISMLKQRLLTQLS